MLLCSQANLAANWFLINPHQELNKAGWTEGKLSKYELILCGFCEGSCSFHHTIFTKINFTNNNDRSFSSSKFSV